MTDKTVTLESYRRDISPEALLSLDAKKAEKIFNKLSLDRQRDIVLAAPWEKRMAVILLAAHARELVHALPEEELYWTIKHKGIEDSLALIGMTTHEQFQFMIDVDCWDKAGAIDTQSTNTWYGLLARCHESKVLEWFTKADEEFLIASLKKFVKVFKIEDELDLSEEYENMPAFTIDNVYFFRFLHDDTRIHVIPLLQALYQNDRGRFTTLIEGVIWDSPQEAEEDALHWRQSRMSEHGFPDLDESLRIYQSISDKEIALLLKGRATNDRHGSDGTAERSLSHLRHSIGAHMPVSFLHHCLQSIDDQQQFDDVQRYIVNLANKILVADAGEVKDSEAMQGALKKAMGFMNIGLELLSGCDIDKAAGFLVHVHPEILFRTGYSSIIKLKERLVRHAGTVWLNDRQRFAAFYDTPWADAVLALQIKRPLLFEGIINKGSVAYKHFETMDEVTALEQAIDILCCADTLLFKTFHIDPEYLFTDFIRETTLQDASALTCTAVFVTLLAQHVIHGNAVLTPLTSEDLSRFIEKAFEKQGQNERYMLKNSFDSECVAWLSERYACDERGRRTLERFVAHCCAAIDDEFSALIPQKRFDTRYITGILLRKNTASSGDVM